MVPDSSVVVPSIKKQGVTKRISKKWNETIDLAMHENRNALSVKNNKPKRRSKKRNDGIYIIIEVILCFLLVYGVC